MMAEGHRREEYEILRQQPPSAFGDKWLVPPDRAGRGASVLTRKKRWSYDLRYHGKRRTSKKFKIGRKR